MSEIAVQSRRFDVIGPFPPEPLSHSECARSWSRLLAGFVVRSSAQQNLG